MGLPIQITEISDTGEVVAVERVNDFRTDVSLREIVEAIQLEHLNVVRIVIDIAADPVCQ